MFRKLRPSRNTTGVAALVVAAVVFAVGATLGLFELLDTPAMIQGAVQSVPLIKRPTPWGVTLAVVVFCAFLGGFLIYFAIRLPRPSGEEDSTPTIETTKDVTDVTIAEAAAHVTGETYQVLYRGDPYPTDVADALPIIYHHTKHLKLGPPPYLDFLFDLFNAYPFDVTIVGQLEGIVRVRRSGNVEPLARPPILIERFDNRPYLYTGRIVIRQHLDDEELEYLRHEIAQEGQAFDLGAVRIWCATSDPQRTGKRYRIRLGYADLPVGVRKKLEPTPKPSDNEAEPESHGGLDWFAGLNNHAEATNRDPLYALNYVRHDCTYYGNRSGREPYIHLNWQWLNASPFELTVLEGEIRDQLMMGAVPFVKPPKILSREELGRPAGYLEGISIVIDQFLAPDEVERLEDSLGAVEIRADDFRVFLKSDGHPGKKFRLQLGLQRLDR